MASMSRQMLSPMSLPDGPDIRNLTDDPWFGVALKSLSVAAFHPSEYAKTLIQLGHEPMPMVQTKTLMGKPALGLPSIFRYIGHIKRRDGFSGLYAGLGPRIVSLGVTEITTQKFDEAWPEAESTRNIGSGDIFKDEAEQKRVKEEIVRNSSLRIACAVTTQPFLVLSVRAMAQFVGKETKYSNPVDAIKEVITEDGILGFWKGLVPRCVGEVCLVCLSTCFTYFLNRYIFTEKDAQKVVSHFAGFIASSLVYPFQVVTTCSIVSRSGLAAGYPPFMPLYSSWIDCYGQLKAQNQHKRGSSLLFRYYTGPQTVVGGRCIPLNRPNLNSLKPKQ